MQYYKASKNVSFYFEFYNLRMHTTEIVYDFKACLVLIYHSFKNVVTIKKNNNNKIKNNNI